MIEDPPPPSSTIPHAYLAFWKWIVGVTKYWTCICGELVVFNRSCGTFFISYSTGSWFSALYIYKGWHKLTMVLHYYPMCLVSLLQQGAIRLWGIFASFFCTAHPASPFEDLSSHGRLWRNRGLLWWGVRGWRGYVRGLIGRLYWIPKVQSYVYFRQLASKRK